MAHAHGAFSQSDRPAGASRRKVRGRREAGPGHYFVRVWRAGGDEGEIDKIGRPVRTFLVRKGAVHSLTEPAADCGPGVRAAWVDWYRLPVPDGADFGALTRTVRAVDSSSIDGPYWGAGRVLTGVAGAGPKHVAPQKAAAARRAAVRDNERTGERGLLLALLFPGRDSSAVRAALAALPEGHPDMPPDWWQGYVGADADPTSAEAQIAAVILPPGSSGCGAVQYRRGAELTADLWRRLFAKLPDLGRLAAFAASKGAGSAEFQTLLSWVCHNAARGDTYAKPAREKADNGADKGRGTGAVQTTYQRPEGEVVRPVCKAPVRFWDEDAAELPALLRSVVASAVGGNLWAAPGSADYAI